MHGVALRVNRGIVVDGLAEKGDHPLVNIVHAVVAEPIGEARACYGGCEAMSLRRRPHGHVASVAVAANADAFGIDGILFRNRIYARHNVEVVAAAKIFYVALREDFSLAVAAARVGTENEISHGGFGAHDFFIPVRGAGP